MAAVNLYLFSKTPKTHFRPIVAPVLFASYRLPVAVPFRRSAARRSSDSAYRNLVRAAGDGRRSSGGSNEERETIMLPGCDYNHWLIVMEFPKDPAPTREQMIDTYLNTLATVLGRDIIKKNGCITSSSNENGHEEISYWLYQLEDIRIK